MEAWIAHMCHFKGAKQAGKYEHLKPYWEGPLCHLFMYLCIQSSNSNTRCLVWILVKRIKINAHVGHGLTSHSSPPSLLTSYLPTWLKTTKTASSQSLYQMENSFPLFQWFPTTRKLFTRKIRLQALYKIYIRSFHMGLLWCMTITQKWYEIERTLCGLEVSPLSTWDNEYNLLLKAFRLRAFS